MRKRFAPLFVLMLVFALAAPAFCIDPYTQSILDAEKQRTIRQDSIFPGLTIIDPSKTKTLVVDNGAGGTKTIQAVNVITLTGFTDPYKDATYLQRYVNRTDNNFRSVMWVTVNPDEQTYFQEKGIPITNNTDTTYKAEESVGISHSDGYKVLSLWVEAKYLTRPSFNPDVASNAPPVWNATTGQYDFTNVNPMTLPNFDGIAPVTKNPQGQYIRPFTEFPGYQEYANWLNAWSTASYDLTGGRQFPYTGLGWTWNWNPDPNLYGFALSEFIINGNAEYYYQGLRPALGYFFPIIGQTANETSVGVALDSVYDNATGALKTTIDDLVALDSGPAIAQAFGQISPARANSLTRQTVLGIQEVADTVSDRFTCPAEMYKGSKGSSIWADIKYAWTDSKNETDHFGFDATAPIATVGFERAGQGWRNGLAFSFAHHSLTWDQSGGDADADVPFVAAYASKCVGDWTVGGEIGGGWVSGRNHMDVANISERINGDPSGADLLVGVRGIRRFRAGAWNLSPFVGLQYIHAWEDGYTETGSSVALDVDSRQVDVLRSELGICAEYGYLTRDNRSVSHFIKLRWLAPLTDKKDTITGSIVGNPIAVVVGKDYVAPGNTLALGLATSFEVADDRTIQVGYDLWDELDGPALKQEVSLQFVAGF